MSYAPETSQERRRAGRRLRLLNGLGIAQSLAGISALFLLAARGFDALALAAAALAVLLTVLSLLFFGRRSR